jgi:AbrB family looped-hinge helix DNA binding protein
MTKLNENVMDFEARHSRVNENARILVPASFRRALGIQPGDTVVLRLQNHELRMQLCANALPGRRSWCGSMSPASLR